MIVHYVSYLSPLIERIFTDKFFVFRAKILNLCIIRVTIVASIFEMDVDYEILWNDFVFVLANIFRAKLHLSSLNVIASLDESSIKHDSEKDFVGEASMFENDLHVICHHE